MLELSIQSLKTSSDDFNLRAKLPMASTNGDYAMKVLWPVELIRNLRKCGGEKIICISRLMLTNL